MSSAMAINIVREKAAVAICASTAQSERAYGVDAFRLLSGLPVIAAHAGQFETFPAAIHEGVSLLSKWAVPFFFIVTGYFLGRNNRKERISSAITRTVVMFVVASLLLIPLDLIQGGPRNLVGVLISEFLLSGTHYHLWFLSSMLMGLLLIRTIDEYEIPGVLPALALLSLLGALLLGTYFPGNSMVVGRHLSSIPFLCLGLYLANRSFSFKHSMTLLLVGLGVMIIETRVISTVFSKDIWQCPVLIGTVPFTLGIFGLANQLPNYSIVRVLGQWGARYSACIYITHLYFAWIVLKCAEFLGVEQTMGYGVLCVPLIFAIALFTLMCLDRVTPTTIEFIRGQPTAVQRAAYGLTALTKPILDSVRWLMPRRRET